MYYKTGRKKDKHKKCDDCTTKNAIYGYAADRKRRWCSQCAKVKIDEVANAEGGPGQPTATTSDTAGKRNTGPLVRFSGVFRAFFDRLSSVFRVFLVVFSVVFRVIVGHIVDCLSCSANRSTSIRRSARIATAWQQPMAIPQLT